MSEKKKISSNHAIRNSLTAINRSWKSGRIHEHHCVISFVVGEKKNHIVNGTVIFHYDDNYPYIEISGIGDVCEHSSFSSQWQDFRFLSEEAVLEVRGTSKSNNEYLIRLHLSRSHE